MNIPADIDEIQGLLDVMLERIASLLDRWTKDDEEVRRADALACLHRIAWLYTKAGYLCDSLEDCFPPFQMTSHNDWKNKIRNEKHVIDDFIADIEEHPGKASDHRLNPFVKVELPIAVNAKDLLDLINKSCGELLECVMGIQQALNHDDSQLAEQYALASGRWGNTYWTQDAEKGKFKNMLHKAFEATIEPDQKPTYGMFYNEYEKLYDKFVQTTEGKLWSECDDDAEKISHKIVEEGWNEDNLNRLFLGLHKLSYLKKKMEHYKVCGQPNPNSMSNRISARVPVVDETPTEVSDELKTSIYNTICSLLKKLEIPSLRSDAWGPDKPQDVFHALLYDEYTNPVEALEQKQVWQDLAYLPTNYFEGDLHLNRFLHIVGRIQKSGIYKNKAKAMVETLYPNASIEEADSMRVYIQKGKADELTRNLQSMIDTLCE